jgi:hypothetical protein
MSLFSARSGIGLRACQIALTLVFMPLACLGETLSPGECGSISAQACYELAVRYSKGDGVPKSDEHARDLLWMVCKAGYGQACFTACMGGLRDACWRMGDTADEPWASLRAFVKEQDTASRHEMVARSRNLKFLFWLMHSTYDELKTRPDFEATVEATRARVLEIALTDPDPGLRAWAIKDGRMEYHPATLKEIAQKDPYLMVREAA